MSDVRVTALEPGAFGVEVDEGGVTTGHKVVVPPAFLEERGFDDLDPSVVVEESVRFLLDRQPATAIAPELSLNEIDREFPDFDTELQARLS